MKTNEAPIIVTQTLNAPIEKVWEAITQQENMVQWYFEDIPEFKPEVGFKTSFVVTNEDRVFTHQWTVVEAQVNQIIKYDWCYDEYEGDSVVSFELKSVEGKTELTLTHAVKADFPDGIPEFKRESGEFGWDYFVNDRLKPFVES